MLRPWRLVLSSNFRPTSAYAWKRRGLMCWLSSAPSTNMDLSPAEKRTTWCRERPKKPLGTPNFSPNLTNAQLGISKSPKSSHRVTNASDPSTGTLSSFANDTGLRRVGKVSALPLPPPSDSREGNLFRGLTALRFRYDLSICSPRFVGADRASPANRGFYFRAFDGWITRTAAGYHYGSNWASSTGGIHTR